MSPYASKKNQGTLLKGLPRQLIGFSRRDFLKGSAGAVFGLCLGSLIGGCGGSSNSNPTFPVLVFTDVHFNPFYDPTLFPYLKAADPEQWTTIFQGSGITAPSVWGEDANYPLLALALAGIKRNVRASRMVIFTGDILGHYFSTKFYALNGSNDQIAMQAFTDKTIAFFTKQVRAAVGTVSIMFVLGNADSYSLILPPDANFFGSTAGFYYSQFLQSAADQSTFLATFNSGGYYSAEPEEMNLVVIGLNTYEFSQPFGILFSTEIDTQLAWLDATLASAQARGKKVWLLMHVPPGALYPNCVMTNGQLTTTKMMWYAQHQTKFLNILAKYPGLITFTLGAHTHMDEYRIMLPGITMEITPGITPYFNNNPAFKIFTFSESTLMATDYTILNYDLASAPPIFSDYYTFSTVYFMQGFLNMNRMELCPLLRTDSWVQTKYRERYYSGHATSNTFNPIPDENWPIYWAGIGNMDETSFVTAVNTY